jgi:hypothetical protein
MASRDDVGIESATSEVVGMRPSFFKAELSGGSQARTSSQMSFEGKTY